MENNFLTRKDIAGLLFVSVRTVERNEIAWGLKSAKIRLSKRMIRFKREKILQILRKKRLLAF